MNKRYIKWVFLLVWMAVIFLFSSQNGSDSDNNNKFILYILNTLGINLSSFFGDMASYVIRKAAHFTEYFILYYLLFNALSADVSRRRSLLLSLVFTFLYACSDEFHQKFVDGRGSSFKDVMIDTSGGGLGLLIKCLKHNGRFSTMEGKVL